MGEKERRAELLARAEDGVMALVELLGGDPSAPRMQALPDRYVSYLLSLAPTAPGLAGPEPAPPGGPERRTALAAAAARRRAKVAGLLEPLDPDATNPPPTRWPSAAARFNAICDMHLARVAGAVKLAHDGGDPDGHAEGHPGAHWLSPLQLDWLVGVMATGLLNERQLTEQIAYALVRHTAAAGVAVMVRVSRSCQAAHDAEGALYLGGTFRESPLREQFAEYTGAGGSGGAWPSGN